MSDFEQPFSFKEALTFEIASLRGELEQAQKKVTSLKRRIRVLSKHLEEITAFHEPLISQESDHE